MWRLTVLTAPTPHWSVGLEWGRAEWCAWRVQGEGLSVPVQVFLGKSARSERDALVMPCPTADWGWPRLHPSSRPLAFGLASDIMSWSSGQDFSSLQSECHLRDQSYRQKLLFIPRPAVPGDLVALTQDTGGRREQGCWGRQHISSVLRKDGSSMRLCNWKNQGCLPAEPG